MRRFFLITTLAGLAACGKPNTEAPASRIPTADAADGHDCDHAVLVKSVPEEYHWLREHHPGFEMISQSLSSCPQFPVDILEVRLRDGSRRSYYFNIKIVMEEERKIFEGH